MNKILIKFLENGISLYELKKATDGSAGFDLVSASKEKIILKPSQSKLIPCGFSLQMPKDFEAQIRPRSGLALKNMITVLNSPGTIDSDYRGEVCVIIVNHGSESFGIDRGMRIAQIVFAKLPSFELVESNNLDETTRGKGGFGSTGLK